MKMSDDICLVAMKYKKRYMEGYPIKFLLLILHKVFGFFPLILFLFFCIHPSIQMTPLDEMRVFAYDTKKV